VESKITSGIMDLVCVRAVIGLIGKSVKSYHLANFTSKVVRSNRIHQVILFLALN
jgi:hypothetical protein